MTQFIKKIPQALVLLFFISLFQNTSAQITVDSDGNVGVGTSSPNAKLHILNDSKQYISLRNQNSYTGSSYKYGIYNYVTSAGTAGRYGLYNLTYGSSSSTGTHRGIYNYGYSYAGSAYGTYNYLSASGGNGTKYGMYNRLYCGGGDGTGNRYALYSSVGGCTGGFAGYFDGDVYVSGGLTITSDARRKTNITALNGSLGIIAQLNPKTYDYKLGDDLNLPTEKQYGFLAQELEQVLPELVKEVETMRESDEVDEDGNMPNPEVTGTIKTVNYIALIPILVEGMQEQQKLIEAQTQGMQAQLKLIEEQAEEIRLLKADIKH